MVSNTTLSSIKLGPFSCPHRGPFSSTNISIPSLVNLDLFAQLDSLLWMDGHILGADQLPSLQFLDLRFSPPQKSQSAVRKRWPDFCLSLSRIAPNLEFAWISSTFSANLPFTPLKHIAAKRLYFLSIDANVFIPLKQTDFKKFSRSAPFLRS